LVVTPYLAQQPAMIRRADQFAVTLLGDDADQ
jgi:hypothetical protein